MVAARLVFHRPWNIAVSLAAFLAMLALLLWSSQVLIVGSDGVHVFVDARFIVASCIIALLFGLLLPLQAYAIRLAAASAKQTGGSLLGVFFGTASMTCCAPVILPSILSLAGFSGATILSLNLFLAKYWLPLATASVILLSYSLFSVMQSLEVTCRLPASAEPVGQSPG